MTTKTRAYAYTVQVRGADRRMPFVVIAEDLASAAGQAAARLRELGAETHVEIIELLGAAIVPTGAPARVAPEAPARGPVERPQPPSRPTVGPVPAPPVAARTRPGTAKATRADEVMALLRAQGGVGKVIELAAAMATPRGNVENILRSMLADGRVRRGPPGAGTVEVILPPGAAARRSQARAVAAPPVAPPVRRPVGRPRKVVAEPVAPQDGSVPWVASAVPSRRAEQVLALLAELGGSARIVDLAAAIGTTRGNVENVLRGLLAEGRVERGPPRAGIVGLKAAKAAKAPPAAKVAPAPPKAVVVASKAAAAATKAAAAATQAAAAAKAPPAAPPLAPTSVRRRAPVAAPVAAGPAVVLAVVPPPTPADPVDPAPARKRRLVDVAVEPPPPAYVAPDSPPGKPAPKAAPKAASTASKPAAPAKPKKAPTAEEAKPWRLAPLVEPAFAALRGAGDWRAADAVAVAVGCSSREAGYVLTALVDGGRAERRRSETGLVEYVAVGAPVSE